MEAAVLPTAVPRLFVAPSTLDLSGFELEIGHARDRAFRLRRALAALTDPAAPAAARAFSARRLGRLGSASPASARPSSATCLSTVRPRSTS